MAIRNFLAAAMAIACAFGTVPVHAQTSPLYLINGNGAIYQNGAVTGSIVNESPDHYGYAIAVQSTIRAYGQTTFLGAEYTLDGAFTGTTYNNTIPCCVRDGTTDGTYNYAIVTQPGPNSLIYRFGLDWSNPEIVDLTFSFQSLPDYRIGRATGITWDPRDNSFWFSQSGLILNVNSNNEAAAAYLTLSNIHSSLAFDPADNTLWLTAFTGSATEMVQYNPVLGFFGQPTPLNSFTIDDIYIGSEFALLPSAVPEPQTWLMMILGFGMVGGGLRRRKGRMALT